MGHESLMLAESKTGYTFNWSMYTGKESDDSGPLAKRVVLNLVEKLHHQGHHLYFDNFIHRQVIALLILILAMWVLHIFYKNQTKDQLSI